MLVVHGIWAYGALQFWAEDSALPARAAAVPGRPSRASRPHPFAAPCNVIADALAGALSVPPLAGGTAGSAADLVRKAAAEELRLRLPSTAHGPLASPELLRPPDLLRPPELQRPREVLRPPDVTSPTPEPPAGGRPAGERLAGERPGAPAEAVPAEAVPAEAVPAEAGAGRPRLAAWRVPSLSFGPAAAAELLPALTGTDSGTGVLAAGEVELAASVGYLAAVARFAADLAARGRILPALAAEDDGLAARWRPVLSAPDARHARELAAAMPPSCRAAAGAAGRTEPGPLFAELLDALADASVRALLPGPVLPARRGRHPARIDLPERVLLALDGPDAAVELADGRDERDAAELAAAFAGWLAAAALPAGSVRTCFRLVEPHAELSPGALADGGADLPAGGEQGAPEPGRPAPRTDPGDTWRVELSLQSADDPSLMLPAAAEKIWHQRRERARLAASSGRGCGRQGESTLVTD